MAKQDNKQKLIEATDKLLQTNSLFAITTKEITTTAGLSVGVFYNYFKAKEDAFKEVVNRFFKYTVATLERLKQELTGNNIRSEIKFKEALINGIDKQWENNFLNGDIIILSRQDHQFRDTINRYNDQIIELIMDILMITNPLIKEKPKVKAMLVMNLIENSGPAFFKFDSAAQQEAYIDELVMTIYKICFGKES
ncbi:TetR/AcrR family transcriptional regulator [Bombilactobacillus folatiphilus]|uniref:TetR/AcrR family transcriptional regulator n=1 Tax=Bombilactobacillus folatiphilus TaxID=2923362 RepID=A0ABY4PC40_9LACO|nr:TetR/AcrR family transcriptional regulator [Bombilactobacillus folatiphilus]UQS81440.1 TetR/AcrR family transcriptional regulator [Bombilactobacillus folatiphilus]UQS82827.1 TetR/AcrR family transcriptional regulator [Bombilactobacillus folatiphilus]